MKFTNSYLERLALGTVLVLGVCAFLTFPTKSSHAAPPRKPQPKGASVRARTPAAKPKTDPIDRLTRALFSNSVAGKDDNLATACAASNFKNLLFSLDGVVAGWPFSKGEFESTADYKARIDKMENVINGDRKTIVCKSMIDQKFGTYNADRQQFSIEGYALRTISSDEKDTGSYNSSTRMGVKAKVYSSVRIEYDIYFDDYTYDIGSKFGCRTRSYGPMTFPVPSNDAQAMRAGGYLVMIGRLSQPFYSKKQKSGEPTLDDPFDEYLTTLTLQFVPEEILLVTPTGERFTCEK